MPAYQEEFLIIHTHSHTDGTTANLPISGQPTLPPEPQLLRYQGTIMIQMLTWIATTLRAL